MSAAALNIEAARALSYAPDGPGTSSAFSIVSSSLGSLRSGQSGAFTPSQRAKAMESDSTSKKPDLG
jgi:hypothetical protein